MLQTKDKPIQGQPKDAIEAKPEAVKAAQPEVKPAGQLPAPADAPAPRVEPGQFPGQVPVAQPPPDQAKAKAKGEPGDFIAPALWLIGSLLVMALVFWAVRRWRQREDKTDVVSEQLTHFRESYQQGEMSEEEYKRVHALLAGKMQEKVRPGSEVPPPEAREPSGNGPDGGK